MQIINVHVHVKPEHVEAFIHATLQNARNSINEPGIARFDVIQQVDDPTRFILVEIYRTEGAPAEHKKTDHYLTWRDRVAEMMAEERYGVRFTNLFPEDDEF